MSSLVNRRNIALGIGAWKLSRSLQKLISQPEPEPEPEPPPKHRKRKVAILAVGALAAVGAVVALRSR